MLKNDQKKIFHFDGQLGTNRTIVNNETYFFVKKAFELFHTVICNTCFLRDFMSCDSKNAKKTAK